MCNDKKELDFLMNLLSKLSNLLLGEGLLMTFEDFRDFYLQKSLQKLTVVYIFGVKKVP